MASINLCPPALFDFEEWCKWKTRFEQFCLASGLSGESGQRQVSSLMYCMGENAEEVLATTNITNERKKEYTEVVRKFDKYFKVRKNLVYECASFSLAHQLADEPVENFITRLHQLAENYEFGGLKSEMIRDRLVIGICDGQLSECLQMESDLILQKAEKLVRQRAAVSQQQHALKGPVENKPHLEAIKQQKELLSIHNADYLHCRGNLLLANLGHHQHRNADDVGKTPIHVINALLAMQLVIDAKDKDIIPPSVSLRP